MSNERAGVARALAAVPFLKGRKFPVRNDGLLELPERQRELCAAWTSGRVLVRTGKGFDPLVEEVQQYLIGEFGVQPEVEQIPAEQIAAVYHQMERDADIGAGDGDTAHARVALRLLHDAADMHASDLKIIQRSHRTDVRLAVAGREIDYRETISVSDGRTIIAYLFDARDEGSGHTTKQQNEFQSFSITPGKISMPARIAKIRGQKGYHEGAAGTQEHMVLRIVYSDARDVRSLEDLGFDPLVMEDLRYARGRLKGAVILGGETGHGKSTTIIRSVERLYDDLDGQISVVTVEDPVETRIRRSGVIQIPIPSAGTAEERTAAYRAALMHFVRINPHVGIVSEVRDAEGARQMIQFIETGHQVWTTVHIGSVNSILFRMIDMGIEPAELAKPGSITLLMRQCLVPLLCHCARPVGDGKTFRDRNSDGCDKCRAGRDEDISSAWAGYRRMIAVAETLVPDDEYLRCVRRNDAVAAWRHWTRSAENGGLEGLYVGHKLNLLVNAGLVAPHDARQNGADVCVASADKLSRYGNWLKSLAA
ncbi:MAG: ATPase, T2SS/T4P/T4SS family [Rhodobacteraceae bacterium]|nr:ATPase, T2SS/T4P/T4SS family [Paracoccaceae bacterium]